MNLLLFSKWLLVGAVWAPLLTEAEANIEACSPSNNNINIDAQVPGVISSPIFPDGSTDSSCIWKIQAADNFRLAITIEVLKLKGADDYLIIRDGASSFSPLIGTYGPCASGSLTLFSSGSSAFLQTVSAVFSVNDKLRIAYKPTDPDDIDCSNGENPPNLCGINTELRGLSGVITSPSFPNNYDARETCVWTVNAPPGYRVQFTIRWIGIEDHRYSRLGTCGDDTISVSEYRGNYTRDVAVFCGCKTLFSFVSYMEKMWLRFDSFEKNNWPGFYATYKALTPEECPAGKTDCSQKDTGPIGFNAQGQVCTTSPASTQTRENVSTTSKSVLYSSEVIMLTVSSLTSTSNMELATVVTSSPEYPKQSLERATSFFKVSGTYFAKIEDSNSIPPIGQLKPSRDVLTPVGPTEMKGTSTISDKTEANKASHFTGFYQNKSSMPGQTEAINPIASTGPLQSETLVHVPRDTTVKGTSMVADYESNSIKTGDPTGFYQNETSVLRETKTVVHATSIDDVIKPSAFAGSYPIETIVPGETEVRDTSTATEYKTEGIAPSVSIGSYQSVTLLAERTAPLVPKSYLTGPDHLKSQSEHGVNPASESKHISPSKASEETSSGPQTTPEEKTTAQHPPVTVIDSPPKVPVANKDANITLDYKAKIQVVCRPDYIEVSLQISDFPGLFVNDSSIHLEDADCGVGYKDDAMVKFTFGLEECKTEQEDDSKKIYYKNKVYLKAGQPSNDEAITREHMQIIPFQCGYGKKTKISKVSYNPRSTFVKTDADGFGNFTYFMDMYKNASNSEKVTEFPKEVGLGQKMYFGFRVESAYSDLVVFPDVCKATASSSFDSTPVHLIIKDACSRDNTLEYQYGQKSQHFFNVAAFSFKESYDDVYIHCQLTVCPANDDETRCARGCQPSKKKRRSIEEDMSANLYVGPLKPKTMTNESSKEHSEAESESVSSMVLIVAVLVGVLGAVAIGLIAAVVIISRRRNSSGNGSSFIVTEY